MDILVESAVRGTLLATIVAIVLAAGRIRSARAAHRAWTGVAVMFLVLPALVLWAPEAPIPVLRQSAAPVHVAATSPSAEISQVTAVDPVEAPTPPRDGDWTTVALLVYGLGVVVLLARLGLGMRQARTLFRGSTLVGGRLTNPRCRTPVTVGLRAPVVVLPAAWVEWSGEELAAVLTHEEEHVRQRDPLAAFVILLARALFWFHPLVWWLQRRVSILAEEACDATVLARGHDVDTYSVSLLRFARAQAASGSRIAFPASAMAGGGLRRRLRLLENPSPARTTSLQRRSVAGLYAVAALACAAATPTASSRPAPPALVTMPAHEPTGRNPEPQAPNSESSFRWQAASSEHFEILYEGRVANRVQDLMWEAERAYERLTEALKHDLAARVRVIFVPNDSALRPDSGYSLSLLPLRDRPQQQIVISAEALDARPGIMVHELTHQFAFDIVPETSRATPWLIEGLADYQRGVWTADAVRLIRDAVAGAWVPDLDALAGADRYWSHALFDYVESAYGGEGIRRFLFVLRKNARVDEAVPAAFNVSVAAFDQGFKGYVTTRFGER